MRPSMTALLTVLAVAGYQNRDKLAALLGGAAQGGAAQGGATPGGATPDALAGEAGRRGGEAMGAAGAGLGGVLAEGLRDIVESFRGSGQGEVAESWIAQGPNRPVAPEALERAIGADTLEALARQTGLTREDILARLSHDLPETVDRATPDGRLPEA